MKKKLYTILLLACSIFAFAGCGKKETADVEVDTEISEQRVYKSIDARDEIVLFVNEYIPAIAPERDSAVAIYNAYFETETDTDAWLLDLETKAIVDYEVYLQSLKNIDVVTPEVSELKELYLACAQNQYDAMLDVITGIRESDVTYLDNAEIKVEDSVDYLVKYNTKLVELCAKFDITINGVEQVWQ